MPWKVGSGLSSIQDVWLGMCNYIAAHVNNHNEITSIEEPDYNLIALMILLAYFLQKNV